ncbi:hypothetical protein BLNAU_16583 [Blattamonas nauphoetae]|uniref:Uncharacterized protein n=1 Tax=Blattamonas nauphoetae TaxID=2049346 RepID=A0ABQ9X9Y7_9EUKA|nr:hypothetical protein BLNAU_16583 [Blattamonas nauphoetae]
MLLGWADETTHPLQRRDLNLVECHRYIQELQMRLNTATPVTIEAHLHEMSTKQKYTHCTPYLEQVSIECSEWATAFTINIAKRFSQPSEDTGAILFSHDTLVAECSPIMENSVLAVAKRFNRFVPQILRRHTLAHWNQLR